MLLRAIPKSWFSYDFAVSDARGTLVGGADLSNWRERAELDIGGRRYQAHHGSWEKEFILIGEGGKKVVVAEKLSAWKERFSFEYDGHHYELRKESVWKGDLVLSQEGVGAVGYVRRKGMFKREWEAELPNELPVEVRVFIVWLAVLLARRSDSAAASGGA